MRIHVFIPLFLFFTGCVPKPDLVEEQRLHIARAESVLGEERDRLRAMQDSLAIRISENIGLGLTPEHAEEVERAFIQTQEAVVAAAQRNLQAQSALLDSLIKYAP